jgi:hypothetical protein
MARKEQAAKIFEIREMTIKDENGKIWGKSLRQPFLVHDPEKQTIWTKQQVYGKDNKPLLKKDPTTGLFQGKYDAILEKGMGGRFSNRDGLALYWHGQVWATLNLKANEEKERPIGMVQDTIIHESTHALFGNNGWERNRGDQDTLENNLREKDGDKWIDVERYALARALGSPEGSKEQTLWLESALAAREYRHWAYKSRNGERAWEQSEGVAMYAGSKYSGRGTIETQIRILENPPHPNLVESNYDTGLAYATLLSQKDPKWGTHDQRQIDLADRTRKEYGIHKLTSKEEREQAANRALEHKNAYEMNKTNYKIPTKQPDGQPEKLSDAEYIKDQTNAPPPNHQLGEQLPLEETATKTTTAEISHPSIEDTALARGIQKLDEMVQMQREGLGRPIGERAKPAMEKLAGALKKMERDQSRGR